MSHVFGLSVALRLPAAYRTGTGLGGGGHGGNECGRKTVVSNQGRVSPEKVLNANRLIHAMAKQC